MSRFTTVIPTSGPGRNIYEILGKARVLMRQIGVNSEDIDALSKRVMGAPSYGEAKRRLSAAQSVTPVWK